MSKALAIALLIVSTSGPARADLPAEVEAATGSSQYTAQLQPLPPPSPPAPVDDPAIVAGLFEGTVRVNVSQTRRFALPFAVKRIAIADENIADFRVISPFEFYVLGRAVGRTNLIVWQRDGRSYNITLDVGIDVQPLREVIRQTLPHEPGIDVDSAAASIVLKGTATNSVSAMTAVTLANATAIRLNQQLEAALEEKVRSESGQDRSGRPPEENVIAGSGFSESPGNIVQIINLLGISSPQQVMLQVRIAEVSKSLSDRFGMEFSTIDSGGNLIWKIGSSFLGSGSATGGASYSSGSLGVGFNFDAEKRNGLVRILAEPNIVAISGKEASFNVGGKILIPVAQDDRGITLDERDYGVGLKFVPVVLADGRINLQVSSEVSELSKEPLTFSNLGAGAILPRFTTTKVSTTVELREGESLAIGGLLKNTSAATVKRFPLLGDIPLLGSLFRSQDFAKDQTELVVVIRPLLVGGSQTAPGLPTDKVSDPTRGDLWLRGKVEGGE